MVRPSIGRHVAVRTVAWALGVTAGLTLLVFLADLVEVLDREQATARAVAWRVLVAVHWAAGPGFATGLALSWSRFWRDEQLVCASCGRSGLRIAGALGALAVAWTAGAALLVHHVVPSAQRASFAAAGTPLWRPLSWAVVDQGACVYPRSGGGGCVLAVGWEAGRRHALWRCPGADGERVWHAGDPDAALRGARRCGHPVWVPAPPWGEMPGAGVTTGEIRNLLAAPLPRNAAKDRWRSVVWVRWFQCVAVLLGALAVLLWIPITGRRPLHAVGVAAAVSVTGAVSVLAAWLGSGRAIWSWVTPLGVWGLLFVYVAARWYAPGPRSGPPRILGDTKHRFCGRRTDRTS